MRFQPAILNNNPTARRPVLQILDAALNAADPFIAVTRALVLDGHRLAVGAKSYDLTAYNRIFVVGAGKAGAPMAQAAEAVLGSRINAGLVVVKAGHGGATTGVEIVEAAHPVPDTAGAAAGARILEIAENAGSRDLVIALISGGGSALLTAPALGVSLADLRQMTDALLACGATIGEINCLRKHCSRVKGGQLARAAAPATLITLVLSDVVGSPLDVIASGPTVPDAGTWADAWAVVERYDLAEKLPPPIIGRIQAGLASPGAAPGGQAPADTPKPGDPIFAGSQTVIIGDNRLAALAARQRAVELGYNAALLTTFLEGEAQDAARLAVALAREVKASSNPVQEPACLILGGETTVTLKPNPGKGGRNQTIALAAGLLLDGLSPDERAGITIAALATDGTDGPTDSAGGLADGETVVRGRARGLDAATHLRENNAYPFLAGIGDLLLSGPTRTNVNDLLFVFSGIPENCEASYDEEEKSRS
ncbi:MAG: DUF4147 domain-containing protein [Caldilineaceae bacterium]|nr:DUF4147 domain-containing protein [Caldilineaceae bacterium]